MCVHKIKDNQKHFYYTDNKTVKSILANPCQLLWLATNLFI